MPHIGILHTGLRQEEKYLLDAAQKLDIEITLIDLRKVRLDPLNLDFWKKFDCFLERSISTIRGNATIEFLSNMNLKIVNSVEVMQICNDKFLTSCRLARFAIPHAKSILVFNEEQAKEAVEVLGGYPVVIKSREGSWGRFVSKADNENSLESIVEIRSQLGPNHQAHIIQEFVQKPNKRDIRAAVIDGQVVAAIYRTTDHWITNVARGAKPSLSQIDQDLRDICYKASQAVGGGILGIDIFETNSDYTINEINHTMEYKNVQALSGVDIGQKILEHCLSVLYER